MDDGQRRGGLPGAGLDQSTKGPFTSVLVEPRAEEAQGIDQGVHPAQAIKLPLPIRFELAAGHQ
jgi:hypothetical protein